MWGNVEKYGHKMSERYISRHHRRQDLDEARKYEMLAQLEELGLNRAQYKAARSHPIYFEVLRLALKEIPIMNFWVAQYKWLGIKDESISETGEVRIEFGGTSFGELSALLKKMRGES